MVDIKVGTRWWCIGRKDGEVTSLTLCDVLEVHEEVGYVYVCAVGDGHAFFCAPFHLAPVSAVSIGGSNAD